MNSHAVAGIDSAACLAPTNARAAIPAADTPSRMQSVFRWLFTVDITANTPSRTSVAIPSI